MIVYLRSEPIEKTTFFFKSVVDELEYIYLHGERIQKHNNLQGHARMHASIISFHHTIRKPS
jgi:hypothetical protein